MRDHHPVHLSDMVEEGDLRVGPAEVGAGGLPGHFQVGTGIQVPGLGLAVRAGQLDADGRHPLDLQLAEQLGFATQGLQLEQRRGQADILHQHRAIQVRHFICPRLHHVVVHPGGLAVVADLELVAIVLGVQVVHPVPLSVQS